MRNAIGCMQAYAALPEDKREAFIMSLSESDLDAGAILRLAAKEQAVDLCVKKTSGMEIRPLIRALFEEVTTSEIPNHVRMNVIDACITSERDVLMGVHADIVRWNLFRLISGLSGV